MGGIDTTNCAPVIGWVGVLQSLNPYNVGGNVSVPTNLLWGFTVAGAYLGTNVTLTSVR